MRGAGMKKAWRIRTWLCAVAIACLATACGSSSAKPSAGGISTSSSSASANGTPSGTPSPSAALLPTPTTVPTTAPTPNPTPSAPSPTGSSLVSHPLIVGTIPPASIHGARVAEVSVVGGYSPFSSLGYQPPEIAVYADGSVVLGADMWFPLSPADLQSLLSGLQKDLAGQPAVLAPATGQQMPDVGDTVLGVRGAGGGYQTVRANALSRRLTAGAYPAPVVAAYTALEAVKTSSASRSLTPYIGDAVRLAYECPVSTTLQTRFWPDGLPAPTHARGTGCPEMVTVSGGEVEVARRACLIYDSALQADGPASEVPYLAEGDTGIRTCVWRWALPDELSR